MKAKDLKNSILQMAVEGKLVPQDPSDEPASILLDRIREEKHRLIAEGKARFPKGGESVIYIGSDGSPYEKRVDAKGRESEPICIEDEIPFVALPEGWCWARLSSFFTKMGSGSTPVGGRKVYQDEGPMLIRSQNVHNKGLRLDDVAHFSHSLFIKRGSHVLPNDMLLNITGASIGRCAIVPNTFGDADVNQHVLIMRPVLQIVSGYLHAAIISPLVQSAIMVGQVGATKEGISDDTTPEPLILLPPLAEQRRIVERVGELMPLVEEYGGLEDAREALDAALPDRLRKSVLQLAVRGGLVPQDPTDEPAGVLLERIRGQRRQLVAEKKMKAPKGGESIIFAGSDGRRYEKRVDARGRESEPACIEDEIPFEIPRGWEWARLESVCILVKGSGIKRADVTSTGLPCVRYGELYTTYATSIASAVSRTNEAVFNASKKLDPDEVLITLTGENNIDIGRAVFNATESSLAYGGDLLALKGRYLRGDYLAIAINSSVVGSQRTKASTGNIIVHLSAARASQFLLPIPPLAEQRRIIDCVRHIMQPITN